MSLVYLTCTNPDCPEYECDEDGVVTGHKFIAKDIPATRIDPGYIEGACDLCGEESQDYEVERLTQFDIDCLRYNI